MQDGLVYGNLPESECKQQISIAYLQAIATGARCSLGEIRVDFDGVDVLVRQGAEHSHYENPQVEVQLKCTSRSALLRADHVAYPLDIRTYDLLRSEKRYVEAILAVMVVPPEMDDWVETTEEELKLRRCVYWRSLKGLPPSANQESVTIEVPRGQILDVPGLLNVLRCVGDNEGVE